MALYNSPEGLVLSLSNSSDINKRTSRCYNVEHIRNKPYDLHHNQLYWVDEDKLYLKHFDNERVIMQNENLFGVRNILVLENELITITRDHTIGVFNFETNEFKEYGSPNPYLQLVSLDICKIVKPKKVFKINDHDNDFTKYRGQNMLLYTNHEYTDHEYTKYMEDTYVLYTYNEYVHVIYSTYKMVERNDRFILYKHNGQLQILSFRHYHKIYYVPKDVYLYNPRYLYDKKRVNVKSARSV